jgi:hypothetical protein
MVWVPRTSSRLLTSAYTADVPELHHQAAETVSDLFLGSDPQDPGEPPIDLL